MSGKNWRNLTGVRGRRAGKGQESPGLSSVTNQDPSHYLVQILFQIIIHHLLRPAHSCGPSPKAHRPSSEAGSGSRWSELEFPAQPLTGCVTLSTWPCLCASSVSWDNKESYLRGFCSEKVNKNKALGPIGCFIHVPQHSYYQ